MFTTIVSLSFQLTLLMVLSVIFLLCGTNSQTKQATTNSKSKISVAKTKKSKKGKEEGEPSQKSYPAFVMPTKSEMKKIKSAEGAKTKGAKDGFYQEKSDEDDTLEKVESLHLEMSDKTRRAAKKKAKKNV
ncbi:hypothetical protein B9Z55_014604 [Caenorhabditis nigoni]|uniref:Uncharacterized protein n=1 Tax=Caenorhabditis nigoni TaxID=1611254 RepID=A0A2G5U6J2_9PELO|nr:hypothetical protein B9Z55_014604 [Caenorhabditis nigoni]